jgi:hypothetical protein
MEVAQMAPKKSRKLPNAVNVRLPEDLLEVIRGEAEKAERTISQEIRWRLLQSVTGAGSRTMDETSGGDTTALSA